MADAGFVGITAVIGNWGGGRGFDLEIFLAGKLLNWQKKIALKKLCLIRLEVREGSGSHRDRSGQNGKKPFHAAYYLSREDVFETGVFAQMPLLSLTDASRKYYIKHFAWEREKARERIQKKKAALRQISSLAELKSMAQKDPGFSRSFANVIAQAEKESTERLFFTLDLVKIVS